MMVLKIAMRTQLVARSTYACKEGGSRKVDGKVLHFDFFGLVYDM